MKFLLILAIRTPGDNSRPAVSGEPLTVGPSKAICPANELSPPKLSTWPSPGAPVPFVLMTTDDLSWWEPEFGLVDAFIRSRYQQLVDIPVHGDRTVRVLVNPSISAVRSDTTTGWPCYR